MAITASTQIYAVLWKNSIILTNRWKSTLVCILLPVLMVFILLAVKSQDGTEKPATTYDRYDIAEVQGMFGPDFPYELIITPESPITKRLAGIVKGILEKDAEELPETRPPEKFNVYLWPSPEIAEKYITQNPFTPATFVYLKGFNANSTELPKKLEYTMVPLFDHSDQTKWNNDRMFAKEAIFGPRARSMRFRKYNVLGIQRVIAEAFIMVQRNEQVEFPKIYTKRMPFPKFKFGAGEKIFANGLPVAFSLSFYFVILFSIKYLVMEKENKLKETMKMMGLIPWVHPVTWFITFFLLSIGIVGMFTFGIKAAWPSTSVVLLIIFLCLCVMTAVCFAFMVSAFPLSGSTSVIFAAVVILLLHYVTTTLLEEEKYKEMSVVGKLMSSLIFPVVFQNAMRLIGLYNESSESVGFGNFFSSPDEVDDMTLLLMMIMLIVDSCLYIALYVYIENIFPGSYGIPKPFYFCFQKSYWKSSPNTRGASMNTSIVNDARRFEAEESNSKAGIHIVGLRKTFGHLVAVNNITLNIYEDRITVILGHNGAGKTTTMSMITGLIPTSAGTATVNGYDIKNQTQQVRQSLGVCPQHDVLITTLTVEQHMQFFAMLKGANGNQARNEIQQLISEIGLKQKKRERCENLSGGQKRKLSVIIALVGGSKVVILDEPSAGMDPAARRDMWSVLQKYKHGRTLVLTTHYMDEADILGEKIAIINNGKVDCCGSPRFLKKLYGCGYHLTVVKDKDCNIRKLTDTITGVIPAANLEVVKGQEVTYSLPSGETRTFSKLFKELEDTSAKLHTKTFGITQGTMGDVFVKSWEEGADEKGIKAGSKKKGGKKTKTAKKRNQFCFNKGFVAKTGMGLNLTLMYAIFAKKVISTWRNIGHVVITILLPTILMLIVFITASDTNINGDKEKDTQFMTFDLNRVEQSVVAPTLEVNTDARGSGIVDKFQSLFKNTKGSFVELVPGKNSSYDNYMFTKQKETGIKKFNKKWLMGLEANGTDLISHFNGHPFHMEAIGLSYALNAMLRYFMEDSSDAYSITTSIKPRLFEPLDLLVKNLVLMAAVQMTLTITVSCLLFSFCNNVARENKLGIKHLQFLSGVNIITYWLPTFFWDVFLFQFGSMLWLIVPVAFNFEPFTLGTRPILWIVIMFFYVWSLLPLLYFLPLMFPSVENWTLFLFITNAVTGFVLPLFVTILKTIWKAFEHVHSVLRVVLPNYNFSLILTAVTMNLKNEEMCSDVDCTKNDDPTINICCTADLAWKFPGIGYSLMVAAIQGVVFFVLIILHEVKILNTIILAARKQPLEYAQAEDEDVITERDRINNTALNTLKETDALIMVKLSKQYASFKAVKAVSVGIAKDECFGLLGQNGAGKTTTFKILTGQEIPSSGHVYINGIDVGKKFAQVRHLIGYCPQYDALFLNMTARENLHMFGRLRGIPASHLKAVVHRLIQAMMLTDFADKLSATYSGGNKRKLSTAISLIGDPQFIFLDEPSAGMDAMAKRHMWSTLAQIRASGRTLLLTSHSMEECEELCTKNVIMVNGRFMCIGGPQYLKNKFGSGYTIRVMLKAKEDDDAVINHVCSKLPYTVVFGNFQGYVDFHVADAKTRLSTIFETLEDTREVYGITDFSVGETSLEQVFLSIVKNQATSAEVEHKCCKCCCA